jgi:CBS domain-containing membrane protein/CBS domain-containing protein
MRVRDILPSRSLVFARPDDDLGLCAQMMVWADVRYLPVVRGKQIIGVLSEQDILRQRNEAGPEAARAPVVEAIREPVSVVAPETPIETAASMMVERKLGCLPVVGPDGLVGMLTTADLLRHQIETAVDRAATDRSPSLRWVMRPAPAVVTQDMELFDAAALMSARDIRHLPVVDRGGKVVGMLSDRDVRTAIGNPTRFLDAPGARERARVMRVGEAMSKEVVTIDEGASVAAAADRLMTSRVGALPVVDDGRRLVGIVSYLDVIQALR